MKNIILIVLICFVIFDCSKSDENSNGVDIDLTGSWSWMKTTGGIAGINETPESTGDERKLVVSTDSIKGYLNGKLNFTTKSLLSESFDKTSNNNRHGL